MEAVKNNSNFWQMWSLRLSITFVHSVTTHSEYTPLNDVQLFHTNSFERHNA